MKIRLSHRIIAMAVAFVMVIGFLPATAFARTAGKDGSAEMNEAYAAKESLMPVGPSFSTYTLLEWTPESDPDAIYSRASIPLADREGGFVVNPLANPEAKLMLCSLANSDHDNTSTQGTESFLSYSFNYWQYVDSFVYWSGSEEGLIVVPTGEFIDAAHTNGVPVVATLGFPWGSGEGYVEEVEAFVQKAADGSFPVADKMIEVMDYYGFDGYFFNQESYGCSAETAALMNEMIHYMHAKRPDMLISWYDSMTEGGGVSYGNAVNDYNKFWMKDDENGVRGVDEFFMNYNWYESQITGTISTMQSIGRSQFDAFAGIDVQQNSMDTAFRDHLLVDEDGVARISLALYCPNSTLGLATSGANFHEVERTFYTNAVEDPRDTSVDVADSTVSEWAGMSRLFADKTPILSVPFVTDFNSGHGTGYYVDGVLSRDAEWSYQSNQDVMPTWTWIIDSEGSKLEGDYDFDTAYNGGNSIKFHGSLTAGMANNIMLYSTKVTVTDGLELGLTYKGDQGIAKVVAYYGDASTESYDACEQVAYDLTAGEGWTTTTVDLSAKAGKILYAIGIKVESSEDVTGYQLNLGRLTLIEKARASLNGPSSITLDEIMYTDAYTAEARIYWKKVTGASSYEIYKVHADGSKSLIMETPSTAFYIPTLKRSADEADVTLEIVPVNRNGVRGTGTQMVIDWAYGNDDSEEIVNVVFDNVCLNAEVTGVSFENSGEPASKALDGTSANNSKWCATNMGSGWMSINIGREVTVKRWRVEHAEYGGEANNMNTVDFSLKYKDADGNWVEIKRIQDNHQAVTDVLLDEPITASEWMLYVYDDGSSPWGGIRIYEWQMFETDQFPQTDVVPMHFASAVNGAGATDTFTLKNVPNGQTVKVYTLSEGVYTQIGEATSTGADVVIENLDFGTADAGRVYYTTTATAAAESAKMSAPFEAEAAEKSEAATDVSFVKFSHAGSVSSSNGDDIYTTLTVNGLGAGDVIYVYEDGTDSPATKVSLPVAEGETSVSLSRVRVVRAGGVLAMQVKRAGKLISDVYTVDTPVFDEPAATLRVYARNARGETLTGVRLSVVAEDGTEATQLSTTSDSGAAASLALGNYTVKTIEVPEGYGLSKLEPEIHLTIEGWEYTLEITIPDYQDPVVTGVTLSPEEILTLPGSTVTITPVVEGEGYYSEELTWTLEGNASSGTTVADGVVTIAADETASYLTVTAASAVDPSISDYAMVYVTELTNIASNGSPFAYYKSTSDTEATSPATNLFDGDLTTKWQDDLADGYAFYGTYLSAYHDIYGVRIHHAGSAGEDASLNTVNFSVMQDIPGDYYSNSFWYDYYYSDAGYYLSQGYAEAVASVTGNTENVTTVLFDAPVNADGLYLLVTDPNSVEGSSELNLYEMEILSIDPNAVTEIKREILTDLIAEAEALDESGYTTDSWAVLTAALTAARETAANEAATEDEIMAAANTLRDAIDALVALAPEVLSGNADIVAYNGTLLNDANVGPAKLFDGARTNEKTDKWCENGKNLWVSFDLGEAANVSSISIYHAGSNNEYSPTPGAINTEAYELYVLNTDMISVEDLLAKSFDERTTLLADNSYWTQLAAVTGNKENITTHELALEGVRIFKFNVSDTDSTTWGDCIRVYELEVYGRAAGTAPAPETADKAALNALIEVAETYTAEGWTDESWTDFQVALDDARAVAADPDATQEEVDTAREALAQAMAELEEKPQEETKLQKILHLDNGRKLYSKDWIIALLNEMSAAGYTHLQLAFGNDGLRFVLDDMSVTVGETTYASDDVKAGIEAGNKAYHDEGEKNALTQAEMDEIIAHAKTVGIEIVPHLNMPGHMDALLDAIEYVGIADAHFTGYAESVRSLNLNNDQAVAFTLALLEKYAVYFADAGCGYFHIGADEFANDAYNGNMGFPTMGSELYTKFATFVNDAAAIVKDYGMTPRAWNDGISYTSYTDAFDTDLEITYWSSGWWGYNLASAATLRSNGHGMINTHGDYYYILGVNDIYTPDSTTEHVPENYTAAATYDINSFMGGSTIDDPIGGMFCIWGDIPGAETEAEVASNVRLILRAMALRMDGKSIDGMDTSVVEGGFNEDGTINGAETEQPDPDVEAALKAAQEAQTAAEAAQKAAEEAQRKAEEAAEAAEEAAASAAEDKEAAEAARQEAEEAQAAAEAAQKAAEDAQAAAEAAEEAAAAHDAAAAEAAAEAAKHAQEVAELYEQIAAMKAEMAEYLADAQKAAEEAEEHRKAAEAAELACAKYYALIQLSQYADPHDYYEAQQEELAAAIEAGIEAINEAPTVEAVEEALAEALAAIDAILTMDEVDADKLPFVDVPADSFYYDAVKWALENEITNGTSETTFSPNNTLTRAETVTFLWRAAGKPASSIENPFEDVAETDFFYEAVLWAYETGVTTGMDDTHFGPYSTATRAHVVTFLHRAMGEPVSAAENPFSDVETGLWYYNAVLWAVETGVTTGMSETVFGVNEICNRAQMVTFLYRAYA